MAVYVLLDVDVKDPVAYEAYKKQVPAIIERYEGRYLVRGGAAVVPSGDWAFHRVVLLEFPSMDHFVRFVSSPEYQPVAAIREHATHTRVVVMDGYAGKE